MSSKVSLSPPTVHASGKPEPKEEHKDSSVKKKENRIEDPIIAGRVKRLAEHNKQFPFKCQLAFMLPVKGGAKKKVKLSFNLSVGDFLKTCIANLRAAGFNASTQAKFKGGALSFLIDGHPKTLHDLDLSLKIEQPENPKDWQKIHEIIMLSMEETAGLSRPFYNEKEALVVYKQQKVNKDNDKETTFYEEMAIELDGKGHFKKFIFEQPGTVKTTWCTNEHFRSQNEQYLLYAIPTTPCPIELEIVASHQNSSTCSLDALRIDYPLDDSETEDFYYSAVDGWDPKYILELREKGLFDVHKDRIPTIRLGFLRYNAMLLRGYLPTELAFEQFYGQHLASDQRLADGKTALEELEANLEKYLNEHCKNFDKRVLYLLISLGTISRLNIAQATKDKLMALYEKELKKALRVNELPKDFLENANLFFYLYFNDFKAHSKQIEKPLDGFYARDTLKLLTDEQRKLQPNRQLTRLYSKDGKRGDAFVLETTSLPSLRAIQEKLRMARSSDSAFAGLCFLFIPDEEVLKSLLGEKTEKKEAEVPKEQQEKLEFPDFARFLAYVKRPGLPIKKQARFLHELFSSKNKTLKDLDEEQREELKSILIKVLQPSIDKQRTLATALCFTVAQNGISFETIEVLFDALLASSVPWMQLEFIHTIEWKTENLAKHLLLWEKAIEKIKSLGGSNSILVSFFKKFALFCEKAKNANALEEVAKGSSKIVETAISLLNENTDKEVLLCCYQLQKLALLPFMQPLTKACSDLIEKGLEKPDQRIVHLYLGIQHELFTGDLDQFFRYFSAFVKGSFPLADEDSSCTALKDGINYLVLKEFPREKAEVVLRILEGFSKGAFPESLKISMEHLGKYCQGKKVDDLYTLDGFKRLKESFAQNGNDRFFDQCVDYFRVVREKIKKDDLHRICVMGLELFEEAIAAKEISPRRMNLLTRLGTLINFKEWNEEESVRWKKCFLALIEIRKASKKAAALTKAITSSVKAKEKEKVQNPAEIAELQAKLAETPDDIDTLKELHVLYVKANDHENVMDTAESLLLLIPRQEKEERWAVQFNMARSQIALNQLPDAIAILKELLKADTEANREKAFYLLTIASLVAKKWKRALSYLQVLKNTLKAAFNENEDYVRLFKIANHCLDGNFKDAIALIDCPIFEGFSGYMLIGQMATKIQEEDLAMKFFLKAHIVCPNDVDLLIRLGTSALFKEDPKAVYYLEKIKKLDTENKCPQVFKLLAELYHLLNKWYPAIENFAKAFDRKEEQNSPEFYKKFQFAILAFINNIGTDSSPSLYEVNKVKAILENLAVKFKETKFSDDISKYITYIEHADKNKTSLEKGEFTEKTPYFVRFGTELYETKLWKFGLGVFETAAQLASEINKPNFYALAAKGHFNLLDWTSGFSLMKVQCRVRPCPQEILVIFYDGLFSFLTEWQNKQVTPEVAEGVKPFIQEFIDCLKPGELSALAKHNQKVFEKNLEHYLTGSNPETARESDKTEEKATASAPQEKVISEEEASLLKACEQSPNNPEMFMQLGKYYQGKGEKQKAIESFEKVKKLDTEKKYPECYQLLGQIHLDLSNWYFAVWHFAKFFVLQKGKLTPIDLLKLRVAIVYFLHSNDTKNPPSKEQKENVLTTLKLLGVKAGSGSWLEDQLLKYYHLLASREELPLNLEKGSASDSQQEYQRLKQKFLVELGNECYKNKLWQLGARIFETVVEIVPEQFKTWFYHHLAKGYFGSDEWEKGFSLYQKHYKVPHLPKEVVDYFVGGLAMFLSRWGANAVRDEVAQRVKTVIEDFISFLTPKEFTKMIYDFDKGYFLSMIKKFISPKLFAAKVKPKRKA